MMMFVYQKIINQILYKGGKFKCVQDPNIKIVDIDNSKDIQKAKEILFILLAL